MGLGKRSLTMKGRTAITVKWVRQICLNWNLAVGADMLSLCHCHSEVAMLKVTNKQLIAEVRRLHRVETHATALLLQLVKDGCKLKSENAHCIVRDLRDTILERETK
jgi:hypothetical protein